MYFRFVCVPFFSYKSATIYRRKELGLTREASRHPHEAGLINAVSFDGGLYR